jgi:hypothetical protein
MSDVQSGVLNNTTRTDEPETIVSGADEVDNPFNDPAPIVSDMGSVEVMFPAGDSVKTRKFDRATFTIQSFTATVQVRRDDKLVGFFPSIIYARLV